MAIMSTITVIIGIVVLLATLVCYAFVAQSLQNKREQRKRLLASLKNQNRALRFMLNGCPDTFLSKDLTMLIQRSLIDVHEQLTQVEPGESAHVQDLQVLSHNLSETQRNPAQTQVTQLSSLQHIKSSKMSLEEIHRFVHNLESNQRLTKAQANNYRTQIKQLILQATIDGYVLNGQNAQGNDKTKLALHYFDLALQLMQREGKGGLYHARAEQLEQAINELNIKLQAELQLNPNAGEIHEDDELDQEWDEFESSTKSDTWKKKQIYD